MLFISPEKEYPRFYGDIQLAHPGWQLGDPLPKGWVEVQYSDAPEVGENQTIDELPPIEKDGAMVQAFKVRDLTPEELAIKNAPINARQKLLDLGLTAEEIQALSRGLI